MSQDQPKIVAFMPCAGDVNPFAAKSYFAEMTKAEGKEVLRVDPSPGSNLALNFNRALAYALNLRDKGEATHFAMLHSDIQASPWWLDTLYDEMVRTGAHFISAASPIKDGHGVTSTAIARDNIWNPWTRITMRELFGLPETFSIEDLGPDPEKTGFSLLLNTGCMLMDLRPDWWGKVGDGGELEPHFEIRSRIVYLPGMGWRAETETEDWMISRLLNEAGARLFCTRKVVVRHFGTLGYTSEAPWGDWMQDEVGHRAYERNLLIAQERMEAEKKIHQHGYWLEDLPDGVLHDNSLINEIVQMCRRENYRVLDLGCGRGWFVNALLAAGLKAVGIDGKPNVEEQGPAYLRQDLTQPLNQPPDSDVVLCIEVGEHIPAEYEDVLLDNICTTAKKRAIISWALPGQCGHGHVNCRSNEWVEAQMLKRGFTRNFTLERQIRSSAVEIPYFQNTITVYDRAGLPEAVAEVPEEKPCSAVRHPDDGPSTLRFENIDGIYTYDHIVRDTLKLARLLPPDLKGILAIGRKGYLPASILATRLHLPLGDAKWYPDLGFAASGKRQPLYGSGLGGPILVVDDGVGTGEALQKVLHELRSRCPGERFVSAVLVSPPENALQPNYTVGHLSRGQFQEAELLNTETTALFAVDLDGVICENPQVDYESEDEAHWTKHFNEVAPLYLPRLVTVRAIVTSRLEKYRTVTETWLRRWGVKYRELIMHPAQTARERDHDPYAHGIRKGEWYRDSDALLFVESHADQAEQIWAIARKPVLCIANRTVTA